MVIQRLMDDWHSVTMVIKNCKSINVIIADGE